VAGEIDHRHAVAVEDDTAGRGLDLVEAGALPVLDPARDRAVARAEAREDVRA
jgi:hypothetical protein